MRAVEFFGRLLRVPSDQVGPSGPPEDCLHHTLWSFLLPDYDIRLEKCRCHFSALHAEMSLETTRQKCPRLRRRHCGEDREARYLAGRPERNIRQLAPIPNQAQPREVRVRSASRPAARLPGLRTRHRMQPCQDQGHREDGDSHQTTRCAEVHWLLSLPESFYQPTRREGSPPVPTHEEVHSLRVE